MSAEIKQMTIAELIDRWAGAPQNTIAEAIKDIARAAAIEAILVEMRELLDECEWVHARCKGISGPALEAEIRARVEEVIG